MKTINREEKQQLRRKPKYWLSIGMSDLWMPTYDLLEEREINDRHNAGQGATSAGSNRGKHKRHLS